MTTLARLASAGLVVDLANLTPAQFEIVDALRQGGTTKGDLECIEECERFALAALEIEREGRPGASAVAAIDVCLPAFLQETEIADILNLGMVAEEGADLGGILAGASHAQLERLKTAQ